MSFAALRADMSTLKVLFEWGADIQSGNMLHWAAARKDAYRLQVVHFLLDQGAFINAVQHYIPSERTPLHSATYSENEDVVEYLLMLGADASILNSHGKKAIDIAREKDNSMMVEILERRYEPFM
jgi:ankyrin repeat protein